MKILNCQAQPSSSQAELSLALLSQFQQSTHPATHPPTTHPPTHPGKYQNSFKSKTLLYNFSRYSPQDFKNTFEKIEVVFQPDFFKVVFQILFF